MINVINAIIIMAYLIFLLSRGLTPKYRFASWHMFNKFSHCQYVLHFRDIDGTNKKLNPWDYLPHTMLCSSERGVAYFLLFLRSKRSILASGSVLISNGKEGICLKIKDSNVVDRIYSPGVE
jgi:hypothetical protein